MSLCTGISTKKVVLVTKSGHHLYTTKCLTPKMDICHYEGAHKVISMISTRVSASNFTDNQWADS